MRATLPKRLTVRAVWPTRLARTTMTAYGTPSLEAACILEGQDYEDLYDTFTDQWAENRAYSMPVRTSDQEELGEPK